MAGCIEESANDTTTSSTVTSTIPPFPTLTTIDTTNTIPPVEVLPTTTQTTATYPSSTTTSIDKTTTTTTPQTSFTHKIRIGSWNLQRYGPTKAANDEKVRQITNKINDYDIMIVQEITDSSGAAFNKLCAYLPSYKCFASDRVGSDTYKEQYGIIYKDAELINSYMIASNAIERGPLVLEFRSGDWNFNIVTLHTRPNNVSLELTALEYILDTNARFANDTIVMGDLNADCDYYPYVLNLDNWTWGIPTGEDTTTGKTTCAYDRIIFNKEASDNFIKAGTDRNVAQGVSDHYPIFAIFDTSHL